MEWQHLVASAIQGLEVILVIVSIVFLLFGLDDLFIDLVYFVRSLYRRLIIKRRHSPLTADTLRSYPERPLAILVPAWDESSVIQQMLRNMVQQVEYQNYHIFVGTYPNDSETIREVESVKMDHTRVHRIQVPHHGPTNKADCLNWIYQGIKAYEKESGIRFEGFVMQDCEDVLHPLCYKLISHLMGKLDMVQLPVLSLERKWWEFTGGHYLDEFAQLHYKDLVVRETLDRSLPAAGVGCAFSRRALERVSLDTDNAIFNTSSLTEDYDLGLRLKRLGLRQAFVKFFVEREVIRRHPFTGQEKLRKVKELVCVREYFPHTFNASVRQKSRWVLGISLQGWHHLGWSGGWTRCYMLWRDRKPLIANAINVIGYALMLLLLLAWLITAWIPPYALGEDLIGNTPWIQNLLIANAGLLCFRLIQRAYCVNKLYNPTQALLSIPRSVWGNFINFGATYRAVRLYLNSRRTGKPVAWDKTHHYFPTQDQLQSNRRLLGDMLLERQWITVDDLKRALSHQRTDSSRKLGTILQEMGLLSHDQLTTVLRSQG